MINASTVNSHLLNWFADDPDLDGFKFVRGDFVNEDAGTASTGWMGIYRRGVVYTPGQMSTSADSANYDADYTFDIVVQKTHLGSGAEAEDALELLVKAVLDRLVAVPKTYIDHISDIEVQYTYLETDRKTMYFQGALITVTAEISDSVA